MDERNRVNREDLLVAEQAAEWLHRMDNATPEERAAFLAWLKESPKHLREILLATTWEEALSDMDPDHRIDVQKLASTASANVVPVQGSLSQAAHRLHVGPSWPWRASLGFGCAAAIVAAFFVWPGLLSSVLQLNRYTTDIGEQRSIELADGSVVSLNTQSNVRVDLSEEARDVYLNEGQALFAVAHDKTRPFRVHVGSTIVQAIGTKFDVRLMKDRTDVAVAEGLVRVDEMTSPDAEKKDVAEVDEGARLAAGESLSIIADGRVLVRASIDVADIGAWQQRRLIFRNSTLAEIADEFSRYNRTPQIRVEGNELREKRYSATFDADNPESLISYLKSQGVTVDREKDELVVRGRAVAPPSNQVY